MVEWANKEGVFDSTRVLKPRLSGLTRSSSEWRVSVRETWDRVVTRGVDSDRDWLTTGEEDEVSEESEYGPT